eukprot:2971150-Karenia_brevis.AAC.1
MTENVVPLVLHLPVRFAEAINAKSRQMGIFKHARGVLVGWELKKDEEERIMSCDAPEMVLHNMPLKLVIAVDSTSKELPMWNGK